MFKKIIAWQEPLETAFCLSLNANYQENWLLLYSGLSSQIDDSYSYLALYPQAEIIGEDFCKFEKQLQKEENYWFGYLGYGLKNSLEILPKDAKSLINLPNLWMINFNLLLIFDHKKQKIICHYSKKEFFDKIPKAAKIKVKNDFKIGKITSNFSKRQYWQKLNLIRRYIEHGDFYQANLTRKFFTNFKKSPQNIFDLFINLNKISPGNYSAFMRLKENYIISSSPELFLKINENGEVISSPIKGTAPRFADAKLDLLSKNNLKNSDKEKSENLMIVDLMRNDLGKTCMAESVQVKNLFKISSYKTIHHLSSDICGIKDKNFSALEVVKHCFPPGSMTGAPKIKAMEICSKLEKQQRGIYSGAIGFFKGAQICNLGVVIRTIIINKKNIEFQVGGAITFDSTPKKEWQETMMKAKAIAKMLKIKLSDLRKI